MHINALLSIFHSIGNHQFNVTYTHIHQAPVLLSAHLTCHLHIYLSNDVPINQLCPFYWLEERAGTYCQAIHKVLLPGYPLLLHYIQ
jgi:hypothetical protein